jgi:uncharacterized protein YbjT (DUF2867 family)
MRILILGATGRTGRLLAAELLGAGDDLVALVRDPARLAIPGAHLEVVTGSSTDPAALARGLAGVGAVVSALGPGRGDTHLHQQTAQALIPQMVAAGVTRFVGISGASVVLPGDRRGRYDAAVTAVVRRLGGAYTEDKAAEAAAYVAADIEWTLVRPGRLTDGPATGRVKSSANTPVGWSIRRADLAQFLAAELRENRYLRAAPFVGG